MLTRNFNMGTITDKTSDIVSFSNSTLDSAKDLFKKKYNLGGILPSPDSPEVKKVLGAFCDSKRINGNSGDYLGSLDRELNRNGRLSLCSDSKKMLGSGDTILSMVSKLRSGVTFKPDAIASNFIGNELNAMGFQGKVPSCLMDKVLESLKGSFGLPGGLIPKLDMSDLLGDKCIKDSINSGIRQVDNIMKGSMVNTMMSTGNKNMANKYVDSMFKLNPDGTISIIENNLSNKNSVGIAEQLKLTDSYGSKGYVDKNILAVNVNKENSDSSVFKSLDKYYTDNNSSYFKGNSNISNSAGSYLSNIKSNDSLSSSVKTTSLNSATLSKISNLFI